MSSTVVSPAGSTRPVVIVDVLDTLVVDPFYTGMASHFNFDTLDAFIAAKTSQVWLDFETGRIDENELAKSFFKDGRKVDVGQLKQFLRNSYQLIPGVDIMLNTLRQTNIDVHVCSNYPVWCSLIEDSVGLQSNFGVKWTFVSGHQGSRKPDKLAYTTTAQLANVPLASCILIDDRLDNCQGAINAGYYDAVQFRNVPQACRQLEHIFATLNVQLSFETI